jgi:short-subunit dehydrogenase
MNIPKNIIITGASSGLGKELAKTYSELGAKNILLIGRHKKRLEETKELINCNSQIAICSVTDKSLMHKTFKDFNKKYPVDLIIANAGISGGTSNGGEGEEQLSEIFAININGVINSIYPLLEDFKSRKHGHITIVSSIAGYRGLPSAPAYSASKACVKNLGEALHGELKTYGIAVTTICPGYIRTPLTDANKFPMPFLMEPNKAAHKIIKAIAKKKIRYSFPLPMHIAAWLLVALPIRLTNIIVSRLPKK